MDGVETYGYFPTDPAAGFERYISTGSPESVSGTLGALNGVSIKVELWNVLGVGPTTVDLATSVVRVPLAGLTVTDPGPGPDPAHATAMVVPFTGASATSPGAPGTTTGFG